MRKATEQFASNTKLLDRKIQKLYAELDIEKLNRFIDRKLGKDEAEGRFDSLEKRANANDRQVS